MDRMLGRSQGEECGISVWPFEGQDVGGLVFALPLVFFPRCRAGGVAEGRVGAVDPGGPDLVPLGGRGRLRQLLEFPGPAAGRTGSLPDAVERGRRAGAVHGAGGTPHHPAPTWPSAWRRGTVRGWRTGSRDRQSLGCGSCSDSLPPAAARPQRCPPSPGGARGVARPQTWLPRERASGGQEAPPGLDRPRDHLVRRRGLGRNFSDLGIFKQTDFCCREHDHCEHKISAFEYKYGMLNFRMHTISHCDCDYRFKKCLLDVNNTMSTLVEVTFFGILQVPCFTLEPVEHCNGEELVEPVVPEPATVTNLWIGVSTRSCHRNSSSLITTRSPRPSITATVLEGWQNG
ncbi:LOW QUALITY PROTEIN: uncharacterized protein LOC127579194 [Pristis pectinata]|uniref:LOW QUALITY PROTEIN: uncharacterized protein LOC127579194 n=1 Tax=Pristis pectinata TaxID=685728 RepID=UPI00223DB2FE|nr:LOW QUALITY PROTEIN: uncharacterized protein LOC127579194 [Pristis pectinata]